MKHISENDSHADFSTVLRIASGQESEPDFVLVEHAYALPWNSQSETTLAQPRKTLFLSKLLRTGISESDKFVDVENVPIDNSTLPYDVEKGKHLMNECERHVIFAKLHRSVIVNKDTEEEEDSDCDWVEKVNSNGWNDDQSNLFSCITKILDDGYLAKLTLQNTSNEPVKQRAIIDKIAGKFSLAMSRIGWDMKLAQWLHTTLLQYMTTQYIASYLDILQTLKSKIPTLIDKMISHSFRQKRQNFEALNLLLKRPWDPVSPIFSLFKPTKMENQPIIIHVQSGAGLPNVPLNSRRFRFFNSQLQHLVKYVSVMHSPETAEGVFTFDTAFMDVRKKIIEYKEQYPAQPIVLLGWGVGALLACHISIAEKVSANICLGFPMKHNDGMRGEGNDPLLTMNTPTLFVIGQNASDVNVSDIEDFRKHLQVQTSLVVIAGGNNLMKVSADKCYTDGITQSMVDRCLVDEIGEFLTRVFNDDNNNKEPSAISASAYISSNSTISSFTNPLPPKANKREGSRKRKLSPSSLTDTGNIQSSKILKTSEPRNAISQNLGLKIPMSNVSLTKNDKGQMMSPVSTSHVHFSLNDKGKSEIPQEVGDSSSKRHQPQQLNKDMTSTFRISQGVSDANIPEFSGTKPCTSFDSNSLSCGSSAPMATIALGALASVSRQKYQRMIQISESSDALPENRNIFDWNSKPLEKNDPDIDIVGISSVASLSTGNRVFDPSAEFHAKESEVKQGPQQSQRQYSGQKGRRGRPPGRTKTLSSFRPIKSMGTAPLSTVRPAHPSAVRPVLPSAIRPALQGAVRPAVGNAAKFEGPSKERSSMAVLTLSGPTGDGTGVEVAGKGISSLGRGVLTLAKGGTSTVRVYSANNQKLSSFASTSSTFAQPLQKIAKGSLLFTNITASTMGMNRTSDVTTVSQSLASSSIVKRSLSPRTTGQISLNLQGISASRSLNPTRSVSSLNSTIVTSRPTVMILSNASNVDSTSNAATTTTTTTISSCGVKTTKSIIGMRMTIPPIKSNLEFIPESNESFQGSSELDLLASAATERYQKESIGLSSQYPTSVASYTKELATKGKSNVISVLTSEASSKAAPSTIKSNITFISAKSFNKASLTPLLPRQSVGLQSSSSCPALKIPSSKASSIRFIRSAGQPPTMFKTAAVGTTSTGKIVTKTFTVNNPNAGMSMGSGKKLYNIGRNMNDTAKKSRGTSTDFILLESSSQTLAGNSAQPISKKIRNIDDGSQKVIYSKYTGTNPLKSNFIFKNKQSHMNEFTQAKCLENVTSSQESSNKITVGIDSINPMKGYGISSDALDKKSVLFSTTATASNTASTVSQSPEVVSSLPSSPNASNSIIRVTTSCPKLPTLVAETKNSSSNLPNSPICTTNTSSSSYNVPTLVMPKLLSNQKLKSDDLVSSQTVTKEIKNKKSSIDLKIDQSKDHDSTDLPNVLTPHLTNASSDLPNVSTPHHINVSSDLPNVSTPHHINVSSDLSNVPTTLQTNASSVLPIVSIPNQINVSSDLSNVSNLHQINVSSDLPNASTPNQINVSSDLSNVSTPHQINVSSDLPNVSTPHLINVSPDQPNVPTTLQTNVSSDLPNVSTPHQINVSSDLPNVSTPHQINVSSDLPNVPTPHQTNVSSDLPNVSTPHHTNVSSKLVADTQGSKKYSSQTESIVYHDKVKISDLSSNSQPPIKNLPEKGEVVISSSTSIPKKREGSIPSSPLSKNSSEGGGTSSPSEKLKARLTRSTTKSPAGKGRSLRSSLGGNPDQN